jgi:hypothetical protein
MATSRAAPAPARPKSIAEASFPDEAASAAEADWHRFVLEELNGVGTMMRFDETEGGGRLAEIGRRARKIVDTLAWDRGRATEQAWRFLDADLKEPEDVWAPALVLRKLDGESDRVRRWLAGLSPEARALAEQFKDHC